MGWARHFCVIAVQLKTQFWYYDDMPQLPSKYQLFPSSESTLEKRRKALEDYMNKVLKPPCSQSEIVAQFLEYSGHALIKPTKTSEKESPVRLRHADVATCAHAFSPSYTVLVLLQAKASHSTDAAAEKKRDEEAKQQWLTQKPAAAAASREEEEKKRKWLEQGAAATISKAVGEVQKPPPPAPPPALDVTKDPQVNAWWANAGKVVSLAKQEGEAKPAPAPAPAPAAAPMASPSASSNAPSLRPILRDLFNTMDSECVGVLSYDEILTFCRVFELPADGLRASGDKAPFKQGEFIDCFEKKLTKKSDAECAACSKMISSIFKSCSSWRMDLSIIFGYVDNDNNGFMTPDELFRLALMFNPHFTIEKTYSMLARMDVNQDGKVSKDEFMAFFGDYLFSLPKKKAENQLRELKSAGAAGNIMAPQPDEANK